MPHDALRSTVPAVPARQAPAPLVTPASSTSALKGKPFSEQAALVNPATTPVKPSNQAGTASGPSRREIVTRSLQKWYTDGGNAVQDLRNQMGRAGERFADFAGTGVRKLKSVADVAGTLAGLIFGVPGKVAQALGKILVAAYAREPGGKIKAGLARDLDDKKREADSDLQSRYQAFADRMDAATGDQGLGEVQASIDQMRVNPTPDENVLYRDLILQLVDDAGMQVDGSDWQERNLGEYYGSWDWGNPFGLDGHDAANELNKLGSMDPKTKAPFRSKARP